MLRRIWYRRFGRAYTFKLRAQIVNVAVLVIHGRETSSSYAGMANR